MKAIIIEVRKNNTKEGDVSNYKASIKSRLLGKAFNLAKKYQMSTEYVEPDASLFFHSWFRASKMKEVRINLQLQI